MRVLTPDRSLLRGWSLDDSWPVIGLQRDITPSGWVAHLQPVVQVRLVKSAAEASVPVTPNWRQRCRSPGLTGVWVLADGGSRLSCLRDPSELAASSLASWSPQYAATAGRLDQIGAVDQAVKWAATLTRLLP